MFSPRPISAAAAKQRIDPIPARALPRVTLDDTSIDGMRRTVTLALEIRAEVEKKWPPSEWANLQPSIPFDNGGSRPLELSTVSGQWTLVQYEGVARAAAFCAYRLLELFEKLVRDAPLAVRPAAFQFLAEVSEWIRRGVHFVYQDGPTVHQWSYRVLYETPAPKPGKVRRWAKQAGLLSAKARLYSALVAAASIESRSVQAPGAVEVAIRSRIPGRTSELAPDDAYTVGDAAARVDASASSISKWATAGTIASNGKARKERRVSITSLLKHLAARKDRAESAAAVEAKVRRHVRD